jgi:hypothetical protein
VGAKAYHDVPSQNVSADMFRKSPEIYRHAISLGKTCQPAWFLRKNKLRVQSYPLDWTLTLTDPLCTLLETDFEDFFEKPNLQVEGHNEEGKLLVVDTKYGFNFVHDFTEKHLFDEEYPPLKEKFNRRVSRLLEVLNGTERVLFVRIRIQAEEARKITAVLNKKFPNLPYTLFAVDNTEEIREDWKIPNVVNQYLETAPDQDAVNKKYDKSWKKALGRFRFQVDRKNASVDLSGKKIDFLE